MIKITNNKKKIFKLIFLLVTFFYAFGLNVNLVTEKEVYGYSNIINILVMSVLLLLFIGEGYALFKKKNQNNKDKLLNEFFVAGWAFVFILILNFLKPTQITLAFYYLLLTISFGFSSLGVSIFYLAIVLLIQYVLLYNAPWLGDIVTFFSFSLLAVLFSILGYVLKKEREKKLILKGRLKDIEEGVKSFFNDNEEKTILALKEEKRVEKLYNTFSYFEEKVLKILQHIKDLMDPYTVVFLKIKDDGRHFRVFEAISDDDYIRLNDDISIEEGVVGWVYKHKKSISIGNFKGGSKSLNYYDKNVPIKSFMAIPVFWKERMLGVLVIDSLQEDAFSKESENIANIACSQIEEALENAQLIQQIQQQTKEFGSLYDASKKMLSYVSLEDTLNGLLELVGTFINFDVAILCLKEEEGLKVKAAKGLKDDILGAAIGKDSLISWVTKHKQYLDIKRYSEKKKAHPLISLDYKVPHLDRITIFPFLLEGNAIGSFMLGFNKGSLSEYEKNVLEILINQTSVAISNALLFEKVNLMATTDGLTGVYNHRHFQEKLNDALERAKRYNEKLVLMILDIDFFKKVNDNYGHPVGDLVLKNISQCLKSAARKVDFVARYGGEEFAVIMVQTAKEGGIKFAERLRKMIEEKEIIFQGGKLRVTSSIGLACFPDDAEDKSKLIEKADNALYQAKKEGRNRVVACL